LGDLESNIHNNIDNNNNSDINNNINNNDNNNNNNNNINNNNNNSGNIESNMIRVKSSNKLSNNNNNDHNYNSPNSGENSPSKSKNRIMSPILTENFPFSKAPFSPTSTSFSTPFNSTLPHDQNTTSSLPIDWPSSPSQSVMACFSHSSSLDAFIISAVLPVWNHALVRTVRVV
jgi:hypothetical protein